MGQWNWKSGPCKCFLRMSGSSWAGLANGLGFWYRFVQEQQSQFPSFSSCYRHFFFKKKRGRFQFSSIIANRVMDCAHCKLRGCSAGMFRLILTYLGLFSLTEYYSFYQSSTIHSTSRTPSEFIILNSRNGYFNTGGEIELQSRRPTCLENPIEIKRRSFC
jgi:hypothetical protein